jgi:hypothetical protein
MLIIIYNIYFNFLDAWIFNPSLQKIGGQPKATAQFFGTLIQKINATKNWWAAKGYSSIF